MKLNKPARLAPESEADGLVIGSSSGCDDDRDEDQADDGDHLDAAKPEFDFSVEPGPSKVDGPLKD